MTDILDGTGYGLGDVSLAVLITLSALLTYARIGFEGKGLRFSCARMLIGVGFTIWSMRFWHAFSSGRDVIVAPVSMIAIAMVTVGYCLVQAFAIRRAMDLARNPIFCLQKPDEVCHREDRVRAAMEGDK